MKNISNISLVYKTLLLILFIFMIILVFYWGFSKYLSEKIDEGWAQRYINKHIELDKYKTLNPIITELNKVLDMKNNQDIINLAKDETNPEYLKKGLETLERYRLIFENKSYFAAFKNSKNYYYNNTSNKNSSPLVFKLNENNASDKWFFKTLESNDKFNINVDKDVNIKVTKIWINVLLKDNDGTPLGVIGTGFEFDSFIKQSVKSNNKNVENYFIKEDFSIQLAQEKSKVDYASFTKDDINKKTIDLLFSNIKDKYKIQNAIKKLKNQKENDIELIWIVKDKKKQLLGISHLKEINWFSLTLIDSNELKIFENSTIFAVLIITIIIVFLLMYIILKKLIFNPIKDFKKQIKSINSYEEAKSFPKLGSGEIEELSIEFNKMLNAISLEVEKNKQNQKQIIEQAHLAELGNMFNNIIHQWKQPLNIISIEAGSIKILNMIENNNNKEIDDKSEAILRNIVFMDETLNNFRKYLNIHKEKTSFSVLSVFENITKILEYRFTKNKVSLNLNIDSNHKIYGYENEFSQVVLNIINNALDNFEENKTKDAQIDVLSKTENKNIAIFIKDNGSGIPKELLPNKLFEEKVSTKGENGTGIGLFLCKQIIEDHLNGKIEASNQKQGAEFIINLPNN